MKKIFKISGCIFFLSLFACGNMIFGFNADSFVELYLQKRMAKILQTGTTVPEIRVSETKYLLNNEWIFDLYLAAENIVFSAGKSNLLAAVPLSFQFRAHHVTMRTGEKRDFPLLLPGSANRIYGYLRLNAEALQQMTANLISQDREIKKYSLILEDGLFHFTAEGGNAFGSVSLELICGFVLTDGALDLQIHRNEARGRGLGRAKAAQVKERANSVIQEIRTRLLQIAKSKMVYVDNFKFDRNGLKISVNCIFDFI